ncbi:zinc finger protein Gfi-1b [Caerostris extrusa]|uniref:Zinc finger protein Gfi-1b n=1 Tax=Caerostris extrusa TaxID=172846 RepID=A0AAV4XEC1_CAEEX|nr:zinc finger protein Gfi-1b [Caerostris extrusa]
MATETAVKYKTTVRLLASFKLHQRISEMPRSFLIKKKSLHHRSAERTSCDTKSAHSNMLASERLAINTSQIKHNISSMLPKQEMPQDILSTNRIPELMSEHNLQNFLRLCCHFVPYSQNLSTKSKVDIFRDWSSKLAYHPYNTWNPYLSRGPNPLKKHQINGTRLWRPAFPETERPPTNENSSCKYCASTCETYFHVSNRTCAKCFTTINIKRNQGSYVLNSHSGNIPSFSERHLMAYEGMNNPFRKDETVETVKQFSENKLSSSKPLLPITQIDKQYQSTSENRNKSVVQKSPEFVKLDTIHDKRSH